MRGLLWGIVALAAAAGAATAGAEESAYNDAIGARVQQLVDARDFAGLQATEDGYRKSMSRSPSGTINLSSFYGWSLVSVEKLGECDRCDGRSEAFVRDWLRARSHDIAPQMLLAEVLIAEAFKLRGGGYAEAVAPDVWPRVTALNDRAVRHLLAVKSWASADPQWYAAMVHAALLHPDSPGWIEPYVAEGVRRFPMYLPIHRAMVIYLLPQWYGSWSELDQMAKAAAATGAPHSLELYSQIYRAASETCTCAGTLRDTAVDWPMMKRSMQALADHYPSDWNMATFASLSCGADDYVEARYFIDRKRDLQAAAGHGESGLTACVVPPGKFKPA